MSIEQKTEKKYALLIDADNISPRYLDIILSESREFGVISIRRIYGDWTDKSKASWKDVLLENSLIPIQQYTYTKGKNSSDSAMIIDAMDILYGDNVDGFIIGSSDSDFTRLAMRIRESGKDIIGMGESKTPRAFVKACQIFRTLDVLYNNAMKPEKKEAASPVAPKVVEASRESDDVVPITPLKVLKKCVISMIETKSEDDGWLFMGDLGNYLLKEFPDFDCRNYGFKKLSQFVGSFRELETKSERAASGVALVYVRIK